MSGAVNPKDIIEEIWVSDIVDLVWEILRLRRLKVALLNSSVAQGIHSLLDSIGISPSSVSRKQLKRLTSF